MDRALDSDRAAACGVRAGTRQSHAASLVIRRVGLTSTSAHSSRAAGRGHGPATTSPTVTANGPSRRTVTPCGTPTPPAAGSAARRPSVLNMTRLS
jgi:hypothetical protein